jgi:hypothetical protein
MFRMQLSVMESEAVMKRGLMKRLLEGFEVTMTAAAFAEESDVETARWIMAEARKDETGDA